MADYHFQQGNNGRPKGAQNKLTKTVKESVLFVFNEIQDDPKVNLTAFAKKYPRDFYNIAARLIPTEINARLTKISLEIVRNNRLSEASDGSIAPITENGDGNSQEV